MAALAHETRRRRPRERSRTIGHPRRTAGVLVVADPLVRAGLRALLASALDLELVGEAGDAPDAIRLAADPAVAVAVVDTGADLGLGLSTVARIRAAAPGCAILALLERPDASGVLGALRAGARGVAVTGAGEADLVRAVRAVRHGEAIVGAGAAEALLATIIRSDDPFLRPFPQLSEREREVLDLLAAGRPTGQIARSLYLSPKTIRNHVSVICTKLAVTDRLQAALVAREAGLGVR